MNLTDTHRVLHLGLIATRPDGAVVAPPAYGICLGWADVTLRAGTDSFRVWGNTEDPDEDHTFDGTLHVVVDFDGDAPEDEREAGRQVHARYAAWLAQRTEADVDWRLADYVIWSDDQWSENQRTVGCLTSERDPEADRASVYGLVKAECRQCGYVTTDGFTVDVWNDVSATCPRCYFEDGETAWTHQSGQVSVCTFRNGEMVGEPAVV